MKDKRKLPEALRLKIIEACVQRVQSGSFQVSDKFKKLQDEIKEDMANMDFVVEHGTLSANKEDVRDEMGFLEKEEDIDFDSDENEVDMHNISPYMRGVYEKN
jgi:hypothetical protein